MNILRVRRWTAEEFLANRAPWQQLLAYSDSDPLFMSWDWQNAWWRHHGPTLQADLCVLGVYSTDGALHGIAPFYGHRALHRAVFAARRFELLGNTWRNSRVVFSEYLDLIAPTAEQGAVSAAVAGWLRDSALWDELLLCNTRPDSCAARLAADLANVAYVRSVESMEGWSITLPGSFEAFTAQLSSNTRRKVVHQRDKMSGLSFESTPPARRRAALEQLAQFVARRWGSSSSSHQDFHAGILEHAANDSDVRLTELRAGENCLSVMLNLRAGGTEYYLQSGFDTEQGRGVSLGYLHLGHAIEAACHDGIRRFDFLAGRGLNRDYKQDFAATGTPLHSLQVVRKPVLRALFWLFDRLGGRASHTARIGG